jgi:poly-gamma-glutamate synthase PgsB/CapB
MDSFPYLEHSENVAIALKVCELSGVNEKIALEGMLNTQPDPGATIIWELDLSGTCNFFVNALAANDPTSTLDIWNQLQDKIKDSPVCIFLNTRYDRRYRTHQLLNLIFTKIKPNVLIVRGENLPAAYSNYQQKHSEIKTRQLPYHAGIRELADEFSKLDNYFIVGIGNMVGWGEQFIHDLKKYRA